MCLWGVGGFTKHEDENMKKSQGVGLSKGEQWATMWIKREEGRFWRTRGKRHKKTFDKSCFQEDDEDQECGGGGGCGVCRARWWKHYEEFTSSWILKRMTIRGEGKGGAQKWKRE